MDSLPSAKWIESLDSTERTRGPMAERFAHSLTLIALSLSTLSKEVNEKVCWDRNLCILVTCIGRSPLYNSQVTKYQKGL